MSIEKPLEKKAPFVVRLFRGDVRLVITYWVFGSLIGALLNVAYTLIEANYIKVATSENLLLLFQLFSWFTVAYVIFIYIAIWRSAGKYQGSAVWSVLAKLMVIIGSLALVGNFLQGTNKDTALQNEIDMTNKSLPIKLDEETLFNSMALNNGNIHYNYTLVNWTVDTLDRDTFRTRMMPKLKTNACDSTETRDLLNEHRKLVYSYRDKNGNPVLEVIVSEEDCFSREETNNREINDDNKATGIDLTEIFTKNNEAIVLIRSYDESGKINSFGTGFNIHENGVIVTNLHVVISGGSYLDVKFPKHGTYENVYIAGLSNTDIDLAVLRIDGKGLPKVNITDKNQRAVGEKVYTIGNPEGLVNTLSEGIISAERTVDGTKLFQITAPISEGSSGGPVFDKTGEVIGVASMVMKEGQNLNFAISIDEVEKIETFEEYFTLKDLMDYVNKKVE